MFPPTSSNGLPLYHSLSRLSPTLSSPLLVLFFITHLFSHPRPSLFPPTSAVS